MNTRHESWHARFLEAVRDARVRAFIEAQLPDDRHQELCRYALAHPDDAYCDRVAKALWVESPTGAIHPLCASHLDSWASDVYTASEWQPPVIIPLQRRWHR